MDPTATLGRAEFQALGTGAVVLTTDPTRIGIATAAVRSEVADIDAACSRFRPDSELEVANRSSGHQVAIGPLLAEAIDVALRAAELTDGDVDPTVGSAMKVIGYDRDFSSLDPDHLPVVTIAALRGWRHVRLNRRWGTLRVPMGMQLDLGATAKALAADRAAARAATATGCGVLVSLGGDIATAGPAPDGGWLVKVADWHGDDPSAPGHAVSIRFGAVATSSTTVRRWVKQGEHMHHIVDPSTGRPAEVVWRTATVAAPTCVDANIASTAAIIRGERAPAWLASLGLTARLVHVDGSTVTIGGWPREQVAA